MIEHADDAACLTRAVALAVALAVAEAIDSGTKRLATSEIDGYACKLLDGSLGRPINH